MPRWPHSSHAAAATLHVPIADRLSDVGPKTGVLCTPAFRILLVALARARSIEGKRASTLSASSGRTCRRSVARQPSKRIGWRRVRRVRRVFAEFLSSDPDPPGSAVWPRMRSEAGAPVGLDDSTPGFSIHGLARAILPTSASGQGQSQPIPARHVAQTYLRR